MLVAWSCMHVGYGLARSQNPMYDSATLAGVEGVGALWAAPAFKFCTVTRMSPLVIRNLRSRSRFDTAEFVDRERVQRKGSKWRSAKRRRQLQTRTTHRGDMPTPPTPWGSNPLQKGLVWTSKPVFQYPNQTLKLSSSGAQANRQSNKAL